MWGCQVLELVPLEKFVSGIRRVSIALTIANFFPPTYSVGDSFSSRFSPAYILCRLVSMSIVTNGFDFPLWF